MSTPSRVYSDTLCKTMGIAYDRAVHDTAHAELFPEIKRCLAEHILHDADQGLSDPKQLYARAVAAFRGAASSRAEGVGRCEARAFELIE